MIFSRKPAKNYFIDSENVNDVWVADIVNGLQSRDHIYIFYSENSTHMKSDSVRRLMELGNDRVTWIRCYIGTNALDFQLVTVLGSVVTEGKNDEAVIVSNDAGYDAVVQFWQDQGREVSRMQLDTSAGRGRRPRGYKKPARKIQSQRPDFEAPQSKQQQARQETKGQQQTKGQQPPSRGQQSKEQQLQSKGQQQQPKGQQLQPKGQQPKGQLQSKQQPKGRQQTKQQPQSKGQLQQTKQQQEPKQPTSRLETQTKAQTKQQPQPNLKPQSAGQSSDNKNPQAKAAGQPVTKDQTSKQQAEKTKSLSKQVLKKDQKLITKQTDPKPLPVPEDQAAEKEPSQRDLAIFRSLCRSIPADDISRIHDALQVLLGSEDGTVMFHYIRKNQTLKDQSQTLLLPDAKARQDNYVELICAIEGYTPEVSRQIAVIYNEEKDNGLQGVNLALVKTFGQEQAQVYYPVLKRHFKILDKISQ